MQDRILNATCWVLGCLLLTAWIGLLIWERRLPSAVEQPAELSAKIREADAALGAGNFKLASEIVDAELAANQDLAAAWYLKGRVSHNVGDMARAVDHLRKAIALDPDNIIYGLFLSDMYRQIGWLVKAEGILTDLLEIETNNLYALIKRADIYLLWGDHDRALADLNFAVSSSGGRPEALFARGRLAITSGDLAAARADLLSVAASPNEQLAAQAREQLQLYDLQ